MNKDFSENKLLSLKLERQVQILYSLASYIEDKQLTIETTHFQKLKKYHSFLKNSEHERIQKLNKEFSKVSSLDYQFQVYLMNLERLVGQSKKEYDFIVDTGDKKLNRVKSFPITCLLDSIRSAHNVGAFFRNAECFGAEKLLLCGLTPTPQNIQVQKTAMGCDELVEWQYYRHTKELIERLKSEGYTIWTVETSKQAVSLNSIKERPEKLVLIFGHEQFGVSYDILKSSDQSVIIDLQGTKNSLNVAISQAICLNQLCSLP